MSLQLDMVLVLGISDIHLSCICLVLWQSLIIQIKVVLGREIFHLHNQLILKDRIGNYYYHNYLFCFLCVCVSVCMYICVLHAFSAYGGQKARSPKIEVIDGLWATFWVLGVQSGSAGGVASALSHWVVSLAPIIIIIEGLFCLMGSGFSSSWRGRHGGWRLLVCI